MSEQQNNIVDLNEYREHRRGSAELTPHTEIDFHKSNPQLLSPEAASKLLLLQQVHEASRGKEKSQAQMIAEYAIACGLNLSYYRDPEEHLAKAG